MDCPRVPRKRDAVATRAAILTAARQRFVVESYDAVGLRDIATDAGVDVALIGRYFRGKEGLFEDVLADDRRLDFFREAQSPTDLSTLLTRLVLDSSDAERQRRMEVFMILLRSASSPKAGSIVRNKIRADILEPLSAVIGGPDSELRAHLVLSTLMGINMLRSVMNVNPPAAQDECFDRLRRLFDAALTA